MFKAPMFFLTICLAAFVASVQSAVIQCNVKDQVLKSKSDVEGTAQLTATDCTDGITMCKNVTVMNAENMRTGTEFACAEAGKPEGCTITDGKKTCYCTGATCNKYTQANTYAEDCIAPTSLFAIYRGFPLSTVSLSTIPIIVQIQNFTK